LSGKPGNGKGFYIYQGNVRDFSNNKGIVREKLLGKFTQKNF